MKKMTPLTVWFLVLICAIALISGIFLIKRWLLVGKVQKILSCFDCAQIEACVIEDLAAKFHAAVKLDDIRSAPYNQAVVELRGEDASDFARSFAETIRAHCVQVVVGEMVSLDFDYQMTFKGADYIWRSRFASLPDKMVVDYELRLVSRIERPSFYGVMFLKEDAGLELQSFIASKFGDD